MRNGASRFDGHVCDHPPGDDHGHMPAPAETEEGESPLFKLKCEAELWTSVAPLAGVECVSHREQAECLGSFSCSREFFNSLHRLRI